MGKHKLVIAKGLSRAHPNRFQHCCPLHHLLPPLPPALPAFQFQLGRYFSWAFHRTLAIPFHILPRNISYSTAFRFFSQNHYDPLDFNGDSYEICRPLDPGVQELGERVRQFPTEGEAMAFLYSAAAVPSGPLVCSLVWALRDDWKMGLLVLKWCEQQGFYCGKAWDLMIWVLGNHKKFNVAWCLIRDVQRVQADSGRGVLIMMDRYAAANSPSKAVRTFHLMEKFRMSPGIKAFYTLLNALCKYGNVEEAEEYMLLNRKFFTLETEGFNIILNGWCNISVDIHEAKRVWRAMSKYCITPDATSYANMISCFSKEALKVFRKITKMGLQPDSTTFNSLIRPLCEAKKLEEARSILATMIEAQVTPTTETYHAFLDGSSLESTLDLLNQMMESGCGPHGDTFLLILVKFFRLKQANYALKIWAQMKNYDVVPSCAHYGTLVKGLAMCGFLDMAREFHAQMISNRFIDDPKLKILLNRKGKGKSDKSDVQPRSVNRFTSTHCRKAIRNWCKKHGSWFSWKASS